MKIIYLTRFDYNLMLKLINKIDEPYKTRCLKAIRQTLRGGIIECDTDLYNYFYATFTVIRNKRLSK